ncbi:MAG: hypothetical protein WHV66_06140 [Anaerolineales bacterium]
MPQVIGQIGNTNFAVVGLGLHGNQIGSVRQQVHDGDTLVVRAEGNFGVRMLGIDAAEISFSLPGSKAYTPIHKAEWAEFLDNPFATRWKPFDPALPNGLKASLRARCKPNTAANHAMHAQKAQQALEAMILADMEALQQDEQTFRFFIVFCNEVMDRYGRFLGFINRFQERGNNKRPLSYNDRLVQQAIVTPYFIWPNINPFRKIAPQKAVIPPFQAPQKADEDKLLREARLAIRQARKQKIGIFDPAEPLKLLPFELRFLARRQPPDRWVIDLGKQDDVLIRPENYYTIQNIEDRLFIPQEYIPLFVEQGWRKQVL